MPLDVLPSVCPHDCPSTCALEVERRCPDDRPGPRRRANSYTAGVVCAKVARYAERQHHPDRLGVPLRRVGEKGAGRAAFAPIGWDAALDEVAEAFTRAAQRHGSETVWPYQYAGTMGLVQRDGIHRLRNVMRYSRRRDDLRRPLGHRLERRPWRQRGVDSREMAESDLIVVWGGNPVSTQVNAMTHISKARKSRGAKLVVIDPYRTPTAEVADLHLAVRPGTDAALACGVMHVLFKEGFADRAYMAKYTAGAGELEAHLEEPRPRLGRAHHRPLEQAIIDSPGSTGRRSAASCGSATASRSPQRLGPAPSPRPACRRSPAPGSIAAAVRLYILGGALTSSTAC